MTSKVKISMLLFLSLFFFSIQESQGRLLSTLDAIYDEDFMLEKCEEPNKNAVLCVSEFGNVKFRNNYQNCNPNKTIKRICFDPEGKRGLKGDTGLSCTTTSVPRGAVIACEDGSESLVLHGTDGLGVSPGMTLTQTVKSGTGTTGSFVGSGSGQAMENYPPSIGVHYIIATVGLFPSRSRRQMEGGESLGEEDENEEDIDTHHRQLSGGEPFLGEIIMFAGGFPPRGWAFCEGQLLPISSNSALFSILGTTFGGDGTTTFGLPDLRGRVPVGPGTSPGLPARRWGEKFGTAFLTISTNNMPAHMHTIPDDTPLITEVTAVSSSVP